MSSIDEGSVGRSTAFIAVMLTICALAVLLNVLVIFVLARYGGFRTSVDIFLANLAVSDVLHAGIVLPIHFNNVATPGVDFEGTNAVCKIGMFLPLVVIMSSITTMVAIAADRYRVIIHEKKLYMKGALLVIAIIWIVSFMVSAPQLYEYKVYPDFNKNINKTYRSCGAEDIAKLYQPIYASIVFIVAYGVPLISLIICYTKISLYLWKHAKRFRRMGMLSTSRAGKMKLTHTVVTSRNIRVFKMLLTITGTFALLWTPYFILFARMEIRNKDHVEHFTNWPNVASRTMTVLSTLSNPVIYLVFGHQFRTALRKSLVCCRARRPQKENCYTIEAGLKTAMAKLTPHETRLVPRPEPAPCLTETTHDSQS